MDQGKRAWIYYRIDAPEDTHGALKNQRQELINYAEQMGFVVIGSSGDLANGLSLDRTGLKRFMEIAESGDIDVLLVHSMSCIGRDSGRTMAFLEKLAQAGVTVYSPLEGILTFSLQKMTQDVISNPTMDSQ